MAQSVNAFISDLYYSQFDSMIRQAYHWTKNVETAQDLVHEAFLVALTKPQEGLSHPNPEGWLMKILDNLILNELKRAENKNLPIELADLIPAPEREITIEEVLPIQEITEKDLQILRWRYEQQLTYKEMAVLLAIDENACRQRCFRVIQKCKSLLANDFGFL